MRDFNITKYKGNTHYTVNVTDSFGQEHTNFFKTKDNCVLYVYQVWENEVDKRNPEQELLGRAIKNCIEIDKKRGIEPSLD
jgi:hypothetical protein|tara:strand:- start:161 stop:403 length:243 start_codon:yes stop_codon:yes gene_type:complete